jgi:hypothetical protein
MAFFDVVRTRRSVHSFKPDLVPDAELWIIRDGYFRKDLEKMATNGEVL